MKADKDSTKRLILTSLSLLKTSLLSWSFSDMRMSITELCSLFWLFSFSMMLLKWLRFSSSFAIIARSSLFTSLKKKKNNYKKSGSRFSPHPWFVNSLRERKTLLRLRSFNFIFSTVRFCCLKTPDIMLNFLFDTSELVLKCIIKQTSTSSTVPAVA